MQDYLLIDVPGSASGGEKGAGRYLEVAAENLLLLFFTRFLSAALAC